MKSIIVLSVLAIFYFCEGNAAYNPAVSAISTLKTRTQNTANDLTRYSSKLSFDLSRKLSNLKIDQMQNINNIVNPAISDVRSMISAASANGKNAEHCFEPARLRLRDASMKGFKELDECAATGKSSISGVASNIDATVVLGNRIVNDLDAIVRDCYSLNSMQMQSCIYGKLPGASGTVQMLENTASELKRTGDTASSSAVTTAFACNLLAPPKVREIATSVRLDTKKCVDSA